MACFFLKNAIEGVGIFPANFFYYLVVYTIAFFNTDTLSLSIASILVLSLAVAAKFSLTNKVRSWFAPLSRSNLIR